MHREVYELNRPTDKQVNAKKRRANQATGTQAGKPDRVTFSRKSANGRSKTASITTPRIAGRLNGAPPVMQRDVLEMWEIYEMYEERT